MAILFAKEDFEGGSLPASFDANTTEFGTNAVTLDTTSKVVGANSAKVLTAAETGSYLAKTLGASYANLYVQFKVMKPSGFTEPTSGFWTFFAFGTSAQNVASGIDFEFKLETNALITQGLTVPYANTGLSLSANTVTKLEVRITKHASTGRIRIWKDNNVEGSPDYDSGNINTGGNALQKFFVGAVYTPEATGSFYIDDVIVADAFIGSGAPDPNLPNVSDSVTVSEGLTVVVKSELNMSLDTTNLNHRGVKIIG